MKKNKKWIFILLTLVILIWGHIGWTIYQQFKGQEKSENIADYLTPKRLNSSQKVEEYKLLLSYSDPFLKKTHQPKIKESATMNKKENVPIQYFSPQKTESPWPKITYKGNITNASTGRTVAVLSVNKHNGLLSVGEKLQNISVEAIHHDSIFLKKQNEVKWVRK